MEQHFRIHHPEFTSLNDPRLSTRFRRAIQITTQEKLRLNIPKAFVVDKDVLDDHDDDDDDEESESRGKRKRGPSTRTTQTARRSKRNVT